ncbi:MAG TPA: MBL fold metallo-hydrolase [Dehalococcoidia bacterium]|nr:MBL fold metallo-hydrolase [Dehalococcoidia bacterium]
MPQGIRTITLSLPFKMGSVNCYLIETDTGYVLTDTGCSKRYADLERELERAGCKPGNLQVIILTHGDFDHTGNAAYLREKFGAKIAMHDDDAGMVERRNMFWNRNKSNIFIRVITPILFGFGKSQRFSPDIFVEDGYDLSGYGLDARVLHIRGHSRGSIGILTADAGLICGDLFENTDKPSLNSIMDDVAVANVSVEKLRKLSIKRVYPGHGEPFPMEVLLENNR